MTQSPEKKFRIGAITASIWQNSSVADNGTARVFRTVRAERSYRNAAGEWKTTTSFGLADLPALMAVLERSLNYIMECEGEFVADMGKQR